MLPSEVNFAALSSSARTTNEKYWACVGTIQRVPGVSMRYSTPPLCGRREAVSSSALHSSSMSASSNCNCSVRLSRLAASSMLSSVESSRSVFSRMSPSISSRSPIPVSASISFCEVWSMVSSGCPIPRQIVPMKIDFMCSLSLALRLCRAMAAWRRRLRRRAT